MTIRYVDSVNGNNSYNGLSPYFAGGTVGPKLTLNGAEDTPVTPGDVVFVRPGTYRELLTVDISGTFGNPIEYRGDNIGAIWPNPNGDVVRITGSDNDQTAARANCISLPNGRPYRTFKGFVMDTCSASHINVATSSSDLIVDGCAFYPATAISSTIAINGVGGNHRIRNCFFLVSGPAVNFTHTSTVNDTGSIVENCIVIGGGGASSMNFRIDRVGGITIRNCLSISGEFGVRVNTALAAGQVVTVNNSLLLLANVGLQATAMGELVENNNTFFGNATPRSSVGTGTASTLFPPLLDSRWFFQTAYAGAGPYNPVQMATPFDFSSQSQIINMTGTNPPATDLRGTVIQNTQREWGALEYDSTLSIKPRQGGLVGGGGMIVS